MNTEFQDLPNVVSPKEVQTYFGISRSTTYRIFHDATFPAFHIGNRLLVRRDELLGWLEQQKVNKAQNENPKIVGSDECRFMDEHKRHEMDKMDDMFGMQYSISVENQPYPVLCTLSADGCTAHVPDFPKVTAQAPTLEAALLEVKQQIEKALRQYKNPPIPTKQEQIVVPNNSVLVLVKAS